MPRIIAHQSTQHTSQVHNAAFSPDGEILATASDDATVKLWEGDTGKPIATLEGFYRGAVGLAFFPNGKQLAVTDFDSVWIWDVETQQVQAHFAAHDSWVYWVAVSPDGKNLMTVGNDFYLRVWESASHEKLFEWKGPRDPGECVAVAPDGHSWAVPMGSRIGVWDADARIEKSVLMGHRQRVKCVSYSPDGQRLASASYDNSVKIWDIASQEELLTLTGHKNRAWCVTFRPDGGMIASAGWDGTTRLWDAVTGEERAKLVGPRERIYVHGIAFSPDGRTLATCGGTATFGNMVLWDVSELS